MAADYKALLEQFGKDYRAQQNADLMTEVRTLQAGEPRMTFDEAWSRAMAANPQLRQVEEIPRE